MKARAICLALVTLLCGCASAASGNLSANSASSGEGATTQHGSATGEDKQALEATAKLWLSLLGTEQGASGQADDGKMNYLRMRITQSGQTGSKPLQAADLVAGRVSSADNDLHVT